MNREKFRKNIDNKLFSWGAWRDGDSGATQSMWDAQMQILTDGGRSEGYEPEGMSDYFAEMLTIDQAIDRLNPIDRDLVNLKYRKIDDCCEAVWIKRWGRTKIVYRTRLSRLRDTITDFIYK